MSEAEASQTKQWVTQRNGSMQAFVGRGNVELYPGCLRGAVGKPHDCLLATVPEVGEELAEHLRLELTAEGFLTRRCTLPEGGPTLEGTEALWASLAENGITSDDLVLAVGRAPALAQASFACQHWCGGTSLATMPLDPVSALLVGTTPLPLDLPSSQRLVCQEARCRFTLCDLDLQAQWQTGENVLHARALMVATAMADSDKSFGRLWDRAHAIVGGDMDQLLEQMADSLKSRGKVVSSASAATRQSIAYGDTFRWAVAGLVGDGVPASTLLAEAMRFSARISVGAGDLSVDDMLAQDELLETLGLGFVEAEVCPDELVSALKAECFRSSDRFMLPLPKALGRVRLGAVDEGLLLEHAAAWCAAHVPQG